MIRSGLSGAGLATARCREEVVDVPNLGETFLGRETEDARHVLQHVRIRCRAQDEYGVELEPGCGDEPCKCFPAWATQAPLDPRNYGLRRPSASSQFPLGQSRPFPRLPEKAVSISIHGMHDS